tara:strand:+ start:1686 stop:2438 length:753 start_codon:yes stop_codon:yes gene_type:complete
MIFGEVGLNHNGSTIYAKKYIDFHKKLKFDVLTFQIREPQFYERKEKKHLVLPDKFYSAFAKKYSKLKNLNSGISLSSLETFEKVKKFNFSYYKILSIAAKDDKLINKIIQETNAKVYISCGLLKFNDLKKIIKKYKQKSRIKFIYTQLTYEKNELNLRNFFILTRKYPNKFAYGHHYTNSLPIYVAHAIDNIDIFVYLKGNKKIIHPDEKHSFDFKKFDKLLKDIVEIKTLIGRKNVFTAKNTIPDQNK